MCLGMIRRRLYDLDRLPAWLLGRLGYRPDRPLGVINACAVDADCIGMSAFFIAVLVRARFGRDPTLRMPALILAVLGTVLLAALLASLAATPPSATATATPATFLPLALGALAMASWVLVAFPFAIVVVAALVRIPRIARRRLAVVPIVLHVVAAGRRQTSSLVVASRPVAMLSRCVITIAFVATAAPAAAAAASVAAIAGLAVLRCNDRSALLDCVLLAMIDGGLGLIGLVLEAPFHVDGGALGPALRRHRRRAGARW